MARTIRKLLAAILLTAGFSANLIAAEPIANDSLALFPDLVIVGQVIAVDPFSVTIQNTRYTTTLTPQRLEGLRARLTHSKDDADNAFQKALRTIKVTDDSHMQMVFYFDTVNQLFHDDINTYQQFLPLFYLFKSNIKELQGQSKDLIEKFSQMKTDYFLTIPFVKKLMKNAWFAAVFRIHPETKKIVYRHSRFYETYEELEEDEYARDNQIRKIVEQGLTTTLTVAVVRGHESQWFQEDPHKKYRDGLKGGKGDKRYNTPAGTMGGGK